MYFVQNLLVVILTSITGAIAGALLGHFMFGADAASFAPWGAWGACAGWILAD